MEPTKPEDPAESSEIVLLPSDLEARELKSAKRMRAFVVITFIVAVVWGISAITFAQETDDAAVQIYFSITSIIFLGLLSYEVWWAVGYVHTAQERLEAQLAREKKWKDGNGSGEVIK